MNFSRLKLIGAALLLLVLAFTSVRSIGAAPRPKAAPLKEPSKAATVKPSPCRETPYTSLAEAKREKDPKKVCVLQLSGQPIPSALQLRPFTNLKELSIARAPKPTIPPDFGAVSAGKQLAVLQIVDSGITRLPASLSALNISEQLNLSGNALTTLPSEVGKIKLGTAQRPAFLDLSNNKLKDIPPLGKAMVLETLNLSGNAIATPKAAAILKAGAVGQIVLGGNPITASAVQVLQKEVGKAVRVEQYESAPVVKESPTATPPVGASPAAGSSAPASVSSSFGAPSVPSGGSGGGGGGGGGRSSTSSGSSSGGGGGGGGGGGAAAPTGGAAQSAPVVPEIPKKELAAAKPKEEKAVGVGEKAAPEPIATKLALERRATTSSIALQNCLSATADGNDWAFLTPGVDCGDYYPSQTNALFDQVPPERRGIRLLSGWGKDSPVIRKFRTRTLMFLDRVPAQTIDKLLAQYRLAVDDIPRLQSAIVKAAEDPVIFSILEAFLVEDKGVIRKMDLADNNPNWGYITLWNLPRMSIRLESDVPEEKLPHIVAHELLHYAFSKAETAISRQEATKFFPSSYYSDLTHIIIDSVKRRWALSSLASFPQLASDISFRQGPLENVLRKDQYASETEQVEQLKKNYADSPRFVPEYVQSGLGEVLANHVIGRLVQGRLRVDGLQGEAQSVELVASYPVGKPIKFVTYRPNIRELVVTINGFNASFPDELIGGRLIGDAGAFDAFAALVTRLKTNPAEGLNSSGRIRYIEEQLPGWGTVEISEDPFFHGPDSEISELVDSTQGATKVKRIIVIKIDDLKKLDITTVLRSLITRSDIDKIRAEIERCRPDPSKCNFTSEYKLFLNLDQLYDLAAIHATNGAILQQGLRLAIALVESDCGKKTDGSRMSIQEAFAHPDFKKNFQVFLKNFVTAQEADLNSPIQGTAKRLMDEQIVALKKSCAANELGALPEWPAADEYRFSGKNPLFDGKPDSAHVLTRLGTWTQTVDSSLVDAAFAFLANLGDRADQGLALLAAPFGPALLEDNDPIRTVFRSAFDDTKESVAAAQPYAVDALRDRMAVSQMLDTNHNPMTMDILAATLPTFKAAVEKLKPATLEDTLSKKFAAAMVSAGMQNALFYNSVISGTGRFYATPSDVSGLALHLIEEPGSSEQAAVNVFLEDPDSANPQTVVDISTKDFAAFTDPKRLEALQGQVKQALGNDSGLVAISSGLLSRTLSDLALGRASWAQLSELNAAQLQDIAALNAITAASVQQVAGALDPVLQKECMAKFKDSEQQGAKRYEVYTDFLASFMRKLEGHPTAPIVATAKEIMADKVEDLRDECGAPQQRVAFCTEPNDITAQVVATTQLDAWRKLEPGGRAKYCSLTLQGVVLGFQRCPDPGGPFPEPECQPIFGGVGVNGPLNYDFSVFPNVKELIIENASNMTGVSQALTSLPNLKRLEIKRTPVVGGLDLKDNPELRELALTDTKVSGLKAVGLQELRRIFLLADPIATLTLKDLPELKDFFAREIPFQQITRENLPKLRKINMPKWQTTKQIAMIDNNIGTDLTGSALNAGLSVDMSQSTLPRSTPVSSIMDGIANTAAKPTMNLAATHFPAADIPEQRRLFAHLDEVNAKRAQAKLPAIEITGMERPSRQGCGDGQVDFNAAEDCDGDNLANYHCLDLGYAGGGKLACTPACKFDTSQCIKEARKVVYVCQPDKATTQAAAAPAMSVAPKVTVPQKSVPCSDTVYTDLKEVKTLIDKGEAGSVCQLVLAGSPSPELPVELKTLTKLTELNVRATKLADLPSWIGELTNLKVLWLAENELEELPEEIGNLVNLEQLFLYQNKLAQLPDTIRDLTKLKILSARGNLFSESEKARIRGLLPDSSTLKRDLRL